MSGERFEKEFSEMMALIGRTDTAGTRRAAPARFSGIGSMFALAMMLEEMGKKVMCYAPGEISELFLNLGN